jgi:hypothetical protein
VETKEVTIDAGGVKTVNFTLVKDMEGNYTIKIGRAELGEDNQVYRAA